MALSRVKTWISGEVLSSSDLNGEFNNLLTNALSLISPLTGNLAAGSNKITGLAAGSAAGDSLRYEQLFTTSAVTMLGAMDWVKGADKASATTLNLTTATGNAVHVTGTTQIDAVTLGSGMWRLVVFDGALTLTHHATNNNLPGGANITTAAGDRALYWADGTTVYCVLYQPAAGLVTLNTAQTLTNKTLTSPVVTNPDNTVQTLTWTSGGTTAWNMASGGIATVTASTGNTTMGAPTNLKKGVYILHFIQDSTPRTITWDAVFKWPGDVAPALSQTSGYRDIFTFVCDGTNLFGVQTPGFTS